MPNLHLTNDSDASSRDGSPEESVSNSIPHSSRKQVDEEETEDASQKNPRRGRGAVPKVEAARTETESESGAKREKDDGEDDEETGEESVDGEEGPDEYVVEAITGHKWNRGQLLYNTKWQGYGEAENTWEPNQNLLPGASEILREYHLSIGGEPQKNTKSRKSTANGKATGEPSHSTAKTARKRKSVTSLSSRKDESPSSTTSNHKRPRADSDALENFETVPPGYKPAKANWESEVRAIQTIVQDEDTKQLYAFILWTNGKRTKIGIDKVYKHAPQPMLRFYQAHLKFNT